MAEGDSRVQTSARAALGRGFLTDAWYFLGLARTLEAGKMEGRELLGERVAVGRTRAGQAFAISDICPHRATLLSAGRMRLEADGGESLQCPYHGWRFGPDGVCNAIPSLADEESYDISKIRVRRYPTVERSGMGFARAASEATLTGEQRHPQTTRVRVR